MAVTVTAAVPAALGWRPGHGAGKGDSDGSDASAGEGLTAWFLRRIVLREKGASEGPDSDRGGPRRQERGSSSCCEGSSRGSCSLCRLARRACPGTACEAVAVARRCGARERARRRCARTAGNGPTWPAAAAAAAAAAARKKEEVTCRLQCCGCGCDKRGCLGDFRCVSLRTTQRKGQGSSFWVMVQHHPLLPPPR